MCLIITGYQKYPGIALKMNKTFIPIGSEVVVGELELIQEETSKLWKSTPYDGSTVDHRTLLTNQKT